MAAEAVLDITLYEGPHSLRIFHVVNTDTSTSWGSVLDWILQRDDASFERVPPSQWVQKLADTEDLASANPSRKLLGLWEANVSFSLSPGLRGADGDSTARERAARRTTLSRLEIRSRCQRPWGVEMGGRSAGSMCRKFGIDGCRMGSSKFRYSASYYLTRGPNWFLDTKD